MPTSILNEITVFQAHLEELKTEALVLFHFQGDEDLNLVESFVDENCHGQIKQVFATGDFKGKTHEMLMLLMPTGSGIKRVFLVGLGKSDKYTLEVVRTVSATITRKIQEMGLQNACIYIPSLTPDPKQTSSVIREFVIGAELSLYKFSDLKSDKNESPGIQAIHLFAGEEQNLETIQKATEAAKKISEGVYLTRDLVNWPSNFATPGFLAQQVEELSKELNLGLEILDEDALETLGMGSFLSVAKGTDEPAKFIILEHNANCPDMDTIVLIGKGVTFDSGGISIKPSDGMEHMKSDMAGAAAVMGAMKSIAKLDIPVHVVALIPATENMPSGKAYKPADVVKAMNGKTIEVINTDAEGRMILADSLCYAAKYNAKAVIDIATLTGARIVALGDHAIGLFSNSDSLSKKLEVAGQTTYERVWRLPLFDEYREQLNSYVADIKHSGGKSGGSITAAKFLEEFVDGFDWAHLDIAGLVSNEKNKFYTPGWATGIGARLLTQFVIDWVE